MIPSSLQLLFSCMPSGPKLEALLWDASAGNEVELSPRPNQAPSSATAVPRAVREAKAEAAAEPLRGTAAGLQAIAIVVGVPCEHKFLEAL